MGKRRRKNISEKIKFNLQPRNEKKKKPRRAQNNFNFLNKYENAAVLLRVGKFFEKQKASR